ncbi:hypothetical protein HELRODRAFT_166512 [Helobdella robusta]|uniref:Ig-like domain-containing protein n=1 Tax=Helobdella robusta TaxID=6412 RepID=T1EY71_HELRO|nr:hypothetical protein HELRODRAFT_166512 [Helobdella robusta]ESO11510.1 hypothetical protein HELRODRAFT_166512 [Helobdella robusta]
MRESVILTSCYFLCYVLGPVKPKTHITYPQVLPVYLKSGSDLDLMCEQSEGFRVVWSKSDPTDLNREYKVIDSSSETGFLILARVNGVYFLQLKKKDVQTWDSGSYKCSVQSGTDMPFAVDVYVLEGEQDVGEYICQFELNQQNIFNHSVYIHSYPQIKPMGRSKNLAEGNTLEIVCKTWGWPAPNVTWLKEGDTSFMLDRRISFPDNNTLSIDPVNISDRAVYVCRASSLVNETMLVTVETSILLRVRGKFAAVYPFIGLLLEVLVLSIFIFSYERTRQRRRLEQERLENSNSNQQAANSIAQAVQRRTSSHGASNNPDDSALRQKRLHQQSQHQQPQHQQPHQQLQLRLHQSHH